MPVRRLTEEEKASRKAERQLIREQKKAMLNQEKARKKAMRDALKQQRAEKKKISNEKKVNMMNARAERKRERQLKKEAKVAMMPAEKSVMKSSFIGALLPNQSRRLSSSTKAQQLKEERRIRREGIVADMMARRAPAPAPVPIPSPAPAPAPRGRGRPRLVAVPDNIIAQGNVIRRRRAIAQDINI
jgi:hypothetical protein